MAELIDSLLRRHEDKTLEFKRDLSSPDRVIATMVAFANSAGGVIVLGVQDATRTVIGLGDPTKVEERLSNLVADRIVPSLLAEISVVPWRSTYVVVAEVFPSPRRPHFVGQLGPERGCFVRIGSTNRLADESLRAELARGMAPTFDETAISDAKATDLDRQYASDLLRRDSELTDEQMLTLHALDRTPAGLRPTIGGYLLFRRAVDPERMPDAWVQCGRFSGTTRTTIADSRRLDGRLFELVDGSLEFLDRALDTALVITAERPAHQARRPIPTAALREAVINAVVHADYRQQGSPIRIAVYSDRVEIENPGYLLPGLTVEDLFTGVSRLRNRMIGRIFAERGYIEQWGSGIRRMADACRDAGLPLPVIEERPGRVRVTFAMTRSTEPTLTPREEQVFGLLQSDGGTSSAEVSRALDVSDRTARAVLAKLVAKGVAVAIGSAPNDPQRRFYPVDAGPR
jgi:ATP-dependent DNA helicase RecG